MDQICGVYHHSYQHHISDLFLTYLLFPLYYSRAESLSIFIVSTRNPISDMCIGTHISWKSKSMSFYIDMCFDQQFLDCHLFLLTIRKYSISSILNFDNIIIYIGCCTKWRRCNAAQYTIKTSSGEMAPFEHLVCNIFSRFSGVKIFKHNTG